MKSEAKQLLKLEQHLGKMVIGQDEAVKAVSNVVRRNRVGLSNENDRLARLFSSDRLEWGRPSLLES